MRALPSICLLLLALAAAPARAQIVDTLSGFSHSDPGWHGEIEGSLSATGGNSEVTRTTVASRVQWRRGGHLWRGMGAFRRSSSDGEEDAREAFGHLRHNYFLTPAVASLAFTQVQENPFQRLRSRWLLGAGLRLEPWRGPAGQLAVGLAQMTEIERVEGRGDTEVEQRLSSFLSLDHRPREDLRMDLMVFAQPRWSDFGDLRMSADLTLAVKVEGPVELTAGAAVTHDSRPPAGVEKTDWGTKLGLRLSL